MKSESRCIICGLPEGRAKGYCDDHHELKCEIAGIKEPFKYIDRRKA
jgi:hypothetical protein